MTVERAKIKVTLDVLLVYNFDVWFRKQAGQESILSMDLMVPAGIRLDLADGHYACRTKSGLVWQDEKHRIDRIYWRSILNIGM